MPAYPISSAPGISTASTTATQSLRQNNETSQSSRLQAANAPASNDRDNDNDTDVRATQRAQAPQASLNTQGQTVGTTINTTA